MLPAWLEPRTAYLHVPFCAHHCGYCDFAVAANQDHLIELYLDAIAIEMATLKTPRPVETIFLGGGTPTHLSATQLQRLFGSVSTWFRDASEFSIESTPESIAPDKVAVLKAGGVTRVSIGIQSFHAGTLSALDRQHSVAQIHTAAALIRDARLHLSLDLIFGAPGQSLADWQNDLSTVLTLQPDHLSTYGLTYEKGTPLWKRRQRGEVTAATEDLELSMYETAIDTLTTAGFEHYETSNFAKPERRCQHNERYWANHAYYGFGVGAARYVNGVRSMNIRNTVDYIRKVLADEDPTQQSEELMPRERAFETMAVQLRRCEGIERESFRGQTDFAIDDLIGESVKVLVTEGLLIDDGDSILLTRRGMNVADGIIEMLMKQR
ncbi:radical SAM family heme chaperone HemW [soil metagenome]